MMECWEGFDDGAPQDSTVVCIDDFVLIAAMETKMDHSI